MTDLKTTKNKHLTIDERQEIMECLDKGMTFKAIGRRVKKDQTTISKEVKKHITVNKSEVTHSKSDGTPIDKICAKLKKAPFVCNPCEKRRGHGCSLNKHVYVAKKAHAEYASLLRESREGIPLTKDEFWEADEIITNGINKGQRLYHIMATNKISFSKSTAYRHLHNGYFSVKKLDFPRVVKFKKRKKKSADAIPKAIKIGRTYDDFLAFTEEQGIKSWVEMDTVIGRPGGKVIMTFDFTFCNFMFGLLLEDKTAMEAASKIRALKASFNEAGIRFCDIMPLILTDNGGEFANVSAFINDLNGDLESRLFFCDPYQSSQKPRVEKNHTLFRDIMNKGESFDWFVQSDVNTIFSHVNCIKRKILNGKSPYDMFSFLYGDAALKVLGIERIPDDAVVQSPLLLKTLKKPPVAVSMNTADSIPLQSKG